MLSVSKIISSGTTPIYQANEEVFITRLSVVNWASAQAAINIYKVVDGVSIGIISKGKKLDGGSAYLINDGIVLKAGMILSVSTTQIAHVDLNGR
jgi:hypothetical protein